MCVWARPILLGHAYRQIAAELYIQKSTARLQQQNLHDYQRKYAMLCQYTQQHTVSFNLSKWQGTPAVQACMVLRLEAEELTQYTDDLDADAKRELLGAMLHSVEAVLLFFRTVSAESKALLGLLDVLLGWLLGRAAGRTWATLTGLIGTKGVRRICKGWS